MKIDKQEIDKRMERFGEACRNSGLKLTHQRMEIFREVAQTADHPDAEKVYRGVRERMPTVSLDTVYRTLWMLKDLGLITTLGSSREPTRFDANLNRHHHFTCVRCGLTRDFDSDVFNELRLPNSVKAFGRVETTQVELKGVCLKCSEEAKKTN
jgi:Fur family peroxide stress response transcriptional regulator